MNERQSGRTTKQMKEAPEGAIYVWVNKNLNYPKQLARELGREDLQILAPAQLYDINLKYLGRKDLPEIGFDHAFDWYHMGAKTYMCYTKYLEMQRINNARQ